MRYASRKNTILSSRDDLIAAKYSSLNGFVFIDEERFQAEKKERENRSEKLFSGKETGDMVLRVPDTVTPSQLGILLLLITPLYEGVRMALTAPFHSIKDLLQKCLHADLYDASEDIYALRVHSISKGSIIGNFRGMARVFKVIKSIFNLKLDSKIKALELKEQEAAYEENRKEANIKLIKDLVPLIENKKLPKEIRNKAQKHILASFGELDHLAERTTIAIQVVNQVSAEIESRFCKCGGSLEIDGEKIIDVKATDCADQGQKEKK